MQTRINPGKRNVQNMNILGFFALCENLFRRHDHRAAIRRHFASIFALIALTLASWAAQKARLTAAVRIFGALKLRCERGMGSTEAMGPE
jgi:hypothetical protein